MQGETAQHTKENGGIQQSQNRSEHVQPCFLNLDLVYDLHFSLLAPCRGEVIAKRGKPHIVDTLWGAWNVVIWISDSLPRMPRRIGILEALLQCSVTSSVEPEPISESAFLNVAGVGVAVGGGAHDITAAVRR